MLGALERVGNSLDAAGWWRPLVFLAAIEAAVIGLIFLVRLL